MVVGVWGVGGWWRRQNVPRGLGEIRKIKKGVK